MTDHAAQRIAGILLFIASAVFTAQSSSAGGVAIVNGTRTAMMSLQLRGDHARWQANALHEGPLGVQRQVMIYVSSDSCIYDLKGTFEDGHRVVHPRLNLCATRRYIFSDY